MSTDQARNTPKSIRRPEDITQQSISTMVEHWSTLHCATCSATTRTRMICSPTSPTAPVRPRPDTLTKLCSALELGNMRPEDLLDPRPMEADEEINHATTRLVTLLKVLPSYNFRHRTTAYSSNPFWHEFAKHLGYSDDYPARKIASKLERAPKDSRLAAAADLATYTLMFFDPADTALIQILADNGNLGSPPGTLAARLWCRDLVEAAWTIHRATITSYPKQVGELVAEATTTIDPERLAELGISVYDVVRGPALARATADVQIRALHEDPSSEVHYEIAKTAPVEVQRVAADLPQSWIGLCTNTHIAHDIATPLLDTLIAALPGPHGDTAGQAILELAERPAMPRPLLEHIAELVKDPTDDPTQDKWLTTIRQYIGDTLKATTNSTKPAPVTPKPVAQNCTSSKHKTPPDTPGGAGSSANNVTVPTTLAEHGRPFTIGRPDARSPLPLSAAPLVLID